MLTHFSLSNKDFLPSDRELEKILLLVYFTTTNDALVEEQSRFSHFMFAVAAERMLENGRVI
jgi:hypothetical protein